MKASVDILVALFAYAGNGGVAAVLPQTAIWLSHTTVKAHKDDRVGRFDVKIYGDIPLTAERNRVVADAKAGGYDVIVMIDSDNWVDLYVGSDPKAKPFWDTAFTFAFERLLRGVPSVVASPYCGPPPHPVNGGEENVYVFYFQDRMTGESDPAIRLEAYSREHASQMRGIQEIGAGPTGVILYTTNAFDLLQFDRRPTEQILMDFKSGLMTVEKCVREIRKQSWFWYEYTNQEQTRKCSTEDVVNLREIGMAGQLKHGEPVVFCAWDCWSGHMKPRCVGRPEPIRMEQVSQVYQEAVLKNVKADECIADVDFLGGHKADPVAYEQAAENVFRKADPEKELSENYEIPENRNSGETLDAPSLVNPEIKARMICGRKATSVGHVTPDKDLEALTAMASNVAKLVAQTERAERPLRMLEVGTWVGESAIALLGGAPKDSRIYCVDHWEGTPTDWTCHIAKEVNVWDWFLKNTEDLVGTSIFPVKGNSVQAAQDLGDSQELDLIFLDANHDEAAVTADIHAWLRHLSPTGVLCGHDYCGEFPGVVNALESFLGPLGLTPSRIHGTTVWFVTKTQIDRAFVATLSQTELPVLDPTIAANRA